MGTVDVAEFWSRVDRESGEGGCWRWKGMKNHSGYGVVHAGRRRFRAHRLAYELAYGVSPGNLYVCHRCDNVWCVNPSHLFLGTQLDNMRDCKVKGRGPVGTASGRARLTETDVVAMRDMYRGGRRVAHIATQFGVKYNSALYAITGVTWKHTPNPASKRPRKRHECKSQKDRLGQDSR